MSSKKLVEPLEVRLVTSLGARSFKKTLPSGTEVREVSADSLTPDKHLEWGFQAKIGERVWCNCCSECKPILE